MFRGRGNQGRPGRRHPWGYRDAAIRAIIMTADPVTTFEGARMTESPHPPRQDPLTARDLAAGEQYAEAHDPGRGEQYAGTPVADPWDPEPQDAAAHDLTPAEQYAGDPLPDPWEVETDGELDPGAVPGGPA